MSHFYLRIVLLPLLTFTAALLLIHSQPYDDRDLRELLLPEGCPAPCFMGIRPGVTTRDEVIQAAKANQQFITQSSHLEEEEYYVPLFLIWSKNEPRFVNGASQLTIAFQNTKPIQVNQILFRPYEVRLGDFYLALGKPSRYIGPVISSRSKTNHSTASVIYVYDNYNMSLLTISECPIRVNNLLQETIQRIEYDARMRMDGMEQLRSFKNCH